jgi:hypothetical protein
MAVILVLCWALCVETLPPAGDAPGSGPELTISAYAVRGPIVIEADDEFTSENGVSSGSGTDDDPYVISGWEIDMDGEPWPESAVYVANTTAVFVVSDLFVHGDDEASARGICLQNVTRGGIEGCRIDGLDTGIGVRSSSGVIIGRNILIGAKCSISGSTDVAFEENEGFRTAVNVGSSSNVTVAHNEVNYSLSADTPDGFAVDISNSDRCSVLDNALWAVQETSPRGPSLTVYRSTNCSVHGNSLNEQGIHFDAHVLPQIATHDIGADNTVKMLPLLFIGNRSGVVVDRAGFGQLVIANCSDVRLQDLTVSGLGCPVRLLFCSDAEVSDCTFSDMWRALIVSYSTGVRLRHNEFLNETEVWVQTCSGLDFSDNEFVSESYGALYAGGMSDSAIYDNRFDVGWGVVDLYGSTNLTVWNNVLPLGGIRLSGYDPAEYDSHTIDQSNLIADKPVLYLAGEVGGDFDLSNNSQLILAGCSGVDLHGMRTSASNAIQAGFSEDVAVHDCSVYGSNPIDLHYADNITFYENDFVNPGTIISLTMTHNVTTYHCNFMGTYGGWSAGGFDNYTPMNIRWDNGYPDGGNYWEGNHWDDDNYSGPGQDIPGADGICDMALDIAWGADRYPLVAPYVHDQWVEPEDAWQDTALWLSAIAVIVVTSSLISYLLFVRERPKRPEPQRTEGQGEP